MTTLTPMIELLTKAAAAPLAAVILAAVILTALYTLPNLINTRRR